MKHTYSKNIRYLSTLVFVIFIIGTLSSLSLLPSEQRRLRTPPTRAASPTLGPSSPRPELPGDRGGQCRSWEPVAAPPACPASVPAVGALGAGSYRSITKGRTLPLNLRTL